MPVPENAQAIYTVLVAAGLSANAAAGILGNVEQESGGNPSAGSDPPGSGLIQQLGYPTGQSVAAASAAIITYIKANGSIADINANASTPSAAALYFSNKYERPNAALANNANRESSAEAVASAAKSGNWPASTALTGDSVTPGGGSVLSGILDLPASIGSFFGDADTFVNKLMWLVNPASWVRIGAFIAGVAMLLLAAYAFIAIGEGSDKIMPSMPTVMPVPVLWHGHYSPRVRHLSHGLTRC